MAFGFIASLFSLPFARSAQAPRCTSSRQSKPILISYAPRNDKVKKSSPNATHLKSTAVIRMSAASVTRPLIAFSNLTPSVAPRRARTPKKGRRRARIDKYDGDINFGSVVPPAAERRRINDEKIGSNKFRTDTFFVRLHII